MDTLTATFSPAVALAPDYRLHYRKEGDVDWIDVGFSAVAFPMSVMPDFAPGDFWEGQIAWATASGDLASDYSAIKTVASE